MLSLLKTSRRVCQSSVNIFHVSKVGTTSTTVIDRKPWKFSASSIVEAAPKSAQPYLRLMRADKPIGTWLLYWPCTWSISLAAAPGHLPNLYLLALFGTGAFLMRGAGCVINDFWDKDFDKKVERTKLRPLASGELSNFQGMVLLGGLLTTSLGILLQLNLLSIGLGFLSMIPVICYPLAKRYTHWPQSVLGLTFNYGAILGYTAATGDFNPAIVLPLYSAAFCWTMIYDTIYAHQDKDDDRLIGVKSTALRFGENTRLWLTGFSIPMISGLVMTGIYANQTWPYYLGITASGLHLMWQLTTVDTNNRDDCWKKFVSNQWIGRFILLGIIVGNLIKKEEKNN